MNIIGKIFGSDKIISKAVDGVYDGMDKLVLTPEERLDNFNKQLALYEPFKLAQRYLALVFCVPYAVAWMLTFLASFWIDITAQSDLLSGTIGHVVLAIAAFYFCGGVVSGLKKGQK